MAPIPGIACMGAAGAAPSEIDLTFVDLYDRGSGTSTTFSSSIGVARSNRIVFITIHTRDRATVSSVTVGGVTATEQIKSNDTLHYSGVWTANVPTGTSASIVVNFPASAADIAVGVYYAYGGRLHDTAAANGSSTLNMNIDVVAGGGVVAASMVINGTNPTWAGLTKNDAIDINSGEWASVASLAPTAAEANRAVSASNSASRFLASVLSWRP